LKNMKCVICGLSIGAPEDPLDLEGWVPFFFEGEDPHGPACPYCSEGLLTETTEETFTLREEYRGKVSYPHDFVEENYEHLQVEEIMLGYILN